jgi:hypothetical protein
LWKDALRKQMPEDLLQSIEQAVIADDVEKLEKLVPRLRSFARGTKTSENSELGIA